MQRLVMGWLILDVTGSVFQTTAVFAARIAPNLVFGPLGGALADRMPRRQLLLIATALKVLGAVCLWAVAGPRWLPIWTLFPLATVQGITMTFEIPSTQALVVDVVGRDRSANGIALYAVATRAVAAVGAFAGGILTAAVGAGTVFLFCAVAFGIALLSVTRIRATAAPRAKSTVSVFRNTLDGLRVMAGIPIVASLLGAALLVEIFGFSFQSVLPAVAKDVLNVGPTGLGELTSMGALGSFFGSVALTALAEAQSKGRVIIGVVLFFGASLVGLVASTSMPIALADILVVGAMLAAFDALQWTLLQANVPDDMRGRVMGGWIFAIGFGWLGSLELGAASEAVGVRWALTANGLVLVALSVFLALFAKRVRRA